MTAYLTFYPDIGDFLGSIVVNSADYPSSSNLVLSLDAYLNIAICGVAVTINAKRFNDEFKTVAANLVDSLYSSKISLDEYTTLNFILHKTLLASSKAINESLELYLGGL